MASPIYLCGQFCDRVSGGIYENVCVNKVCKTGSLLIQPDNVASACFLFERPFAVFGILELERCGT